MLIATQSPFFPRQLFSSSHAPPPHRTAADASRRRRQTDDPWTWFYHTYDEIITHFRDEVVPSHRDIASIVSLGRSYEGRDLMAIRITSPAGGGHATRNGTAVANDKPGFYMESLIHSREWCVPANSPSPANPAISLPFP